MADPEDRSYATTHEWVKVEGTTATVGITRFAVEQLGDLVYVELPEAGRDVVAAEQFGEVESVKAVGDLYAPISGKVTEVNSALAENLEAQGGAGLGVVRPESGRVVCCRRYRMGFWPERAAKPSTRNSDA